MDGAEIVAINKIDLVEDGMREKVADLVRSVSPNAKIVYISAKKAEGLESLIQLLEDAS